jgi:hypothetical protein
LLVKPGGAFDELPECSLTAESRPIRPQQDGGTIMTTSMTTARPALGALLALALAPALWPGDAAAHTCDAPFATDLVTARGIDVGQVKVCNDAEFLTVTYETTFPWCVLKTNLHVASDLAGIPKIKLLGTPNFLRFDFIEDVDCKGEVSFEIPLDEIGDGVTPGEDTVTIAARAVVEGEGADGTHPRCLLGDKCVAWGKGPRFRPRLPAMYFTYEVQAAPPTSCVCDSRTAVGGTTGASILAQLCPGGGLAADAEFTDVPGGAVAVARPGGRLSYFILPSSGFPICVLEDVRAAGYRISPAEFDDCQAHLRVSCGQPEP